MKLIRLLGSAALHKIIWPADLTIKHCPPSARTHHVPGPVRLRNDKFEPPVRIAVDGMAWFALRIAHGCERSTARTLSAIEGVGAYCPLGANFVFYLAGKRTKRRVIRQFPVFSRYLFVGLAPGLTPSKRLCDKIEAVLGDSRGPLEIPFRAIMAINILELAGEWDHTRSWQEKSPFKPGTRVRVQHGPFAGFIATVSALESEDRIKVLVNLFGRETPAHLDACQIELV